MLSLFVSIEPKNETKEYYKQREKKGIIMIILLIIISYSIITTISPGLVSGNWNEIHLEFSIFGIVTSMIIYILFIVFLERKK